MYTEKERRRAVALVIDEGMSCRSAAARLGYPGRTTLARWVREERSGTGGGVEERDTFEDRWVAVRHYLSHGHSLARTVRELGYPTRRALAAWVGELAPADDGGAPASRVGGCAGPAREERMGDPVEDDGGRGAEGLGDLERRVAELTEEVRMLRMQCAVVEEVARVLGKGPGDGPGSLTNREKAIVADRLRGTWPLKELLGMLGLARRTFFHQVRAMGHDKYASLRVRIREVFEASSGTYGYRRVRAALAAGGVRVSEGVVRRLMREEGLVAACTKASTRRYSSYAGEIDQAPHDLLRRDFTADRPGVKLVTDITEFRIPAGKVYLSVMVDCFDGMPVAWTIGTRPDAALANGMLDQAIERVGRGGGTVVHSDRGCHYRWPGWERRMRDAGWTRSMSRKGCSPDNAAAEGFFGNLKMEFFHNRDWAGVGLDPFMGRLDAYLRWFRDHRIKHQLNDMSPTAWRRSLGLTA